MRKMSIGNSSSAYANHIVLDSGVLVYASVVDYDTTIKFMTKNLNDHNQVWISGHGHGRVEKKAYNTIKEKDLDSGLVHMVLSKKDQIRPDKTFVGYIYHTTVDQLKTLLYNKLNKNMSVPLIPEWIDYIYQKMIDASLLTSLHMITDDEGEPPFRITRVAMTERFLSQTISQGLRDHDISIRGTNSASTTMREMDGINNYLNRFGEILAYKIQETFVPKFIPGSDEYSESVDNFEDYCYDGGKGVQIFEAQKAAIQSMVNHFDIKRNGFVIGEMGCGKTLLGCGITYAHGNKTGKNNIVMCPSHLVYKWKREIERFVPNAEAVVVSNIKELIDLEPKVFNKARISNLYIIMSKESAKFDYELRPSVIWSQSKRTFVCPDCGKPLYKEVWIGEGRSKEKVRINLSMDDFLKPNSYNQVCPNEVTVWNKKEKTNETQQCGSKLWTPLIKEFYEDAEWIKLGSEGWIMNQHVQPMIAELQGTRDKTNKERKLLTRLVKFSHDVTDGVVTQRAPRKFSLSKYVKNRWKGHIDFAIFDELHLYKSDSKQGQAMADFAACSKRTLGLTGTLLNGYASGIFYILYRIFPGLMKSEGYEYNSENEFMRDYGVIRRTSRSIRRNYGRDEQGAAKEKALPGISPIVFTKFLLDNAAFVSLSDMAEGLPEYSEHPIAVPMDTELYNNYHNLERELRNNISFKKGGSKILSQMLQCLTAYPDAPHCQPPVMNMDTNEIVVTPREMSSDLRAKELRTIELAERKVAEGEKVLIYYHLTNKTDVAEKIRDELINRGIKAKILDAKIKAIDREVWIEKEVEEGLQVLLCNPTLVETGLDLLDFTTIIFHQVGYNIFTMRQASRRSWRLGQTRPIEVYFMYYQSTIQEQALSLMATKLQASMAIEGKFSEEGLRAMSNNEDLLTQIANSVVNGIKESVDMNAFNAVGKVDAATMSSTYVVNRKRKTRAQIAVKEPKVYTAYELAMKELFKQQLIYSSHGLKIAI